MVLTGLWGHGNQAPPLSPGPKALPNKPAALGWGPLSPHQALPPAGPPTLGSMPLARCSRLLVPWLLQAGGPAGRVCTFSYGGTMRMGGPVGPAPSGSPWDSWLQTSSPRRQGGHPGHHRAQWG